MIAGARAPRRPAGVDRHDQPARDVARRSATCARREAIWAVFGDRTPRGSRSAPPSRMTGHLMGAAGAVEAIATICPSTTRPSPATLNYRDPDPEIDLDIVHGATRPDARSATRSPTTSASAATTAPSSSSATTATDPRRRSGDRTIADRRHRRRTASQEAARAAQPGSRPPRRRDRPRRRHADRQRLRDVLANLRAGVTGVAPITSFDAVRPSRCRSRPRSRASTRQRRWTPRWPAG